MNIESFWSIQESNCIFIFIFEIGKQYGSAISDIGLMTFGEEGGITASSQRKRSDSESSSDIDGDFM